LFEFIFVGPFVYEFNTVLEVVLLYDKYTGAGIKKRKTTHKASKKAPERAREKKKAKKV
jgi:hypothetical protein